MTSFADHARRYSELGWALTRLNGKVPKTAEWQKTRPGEPGDAAGQWAEWGKRYGMGVVLGTSGLAVLEYDDEAARDLFFELVGDSTPPICRTGSGKHHAYFAMAPGVAKAARDGLELRVGAHQCVVPPSLHPDTGEPYEWVSAPWDTPPSQLPERVIAYFKPQTAEARQIPETITRGARHESLVALAASMRHKGLTEAAILHALRGLNAEQTGGQPKPDEELVAIARDSADWRVAQDTPGPPPPLADLLDAVEEFVRRFVVLNDHQADVITLWAAHTHASDAFACTPYLAITSPEKRSGKTRLLEVLELLVREPLPTANISDAALFRVIDSRAPTLLVDEVDSVFGKKSPRDELRGMLNAGYRRGATTHRMGGANNTTLQTFSVYCPKAFAGIGDCLPDTISDRAIPVRLRRRTRDVRIERFRLRDVGPPGHSLRDQLADQLEPQGDYLSDSRPALPDQLDDRAQDVWEPLLAIADLAGDGWPQRARTAALALSSGDERDDDSVTAQLIRDIHTVFVGAGDHLKTADLLEGLRDDEESPWGDWYGKPLSPHGLSRLLKPYRIRTMPVWIEGSTVRGYKAEQFSDAFAQLGVRSVRSVRDEARSHAAPNSPNAPNASPAEPCPLPGDDDYLARTFAAFEAELITEAEWHQADRAHRLVVITRAA